MALKLSFYWAKILLWFLLGFAGLLLFNPVLVCGVAAPSPGGATPGTPDPQTPRPLQNVPMPMESSTALSERQKLCVLKTNFMKMKQDVDELAGLAKTLQEELKKSNENILSLDVLDKADKIEKLAKKIKSGERGY